MAARIYPGASVLNPPVSKKLDVVLRLLRGEKLGELIREGGRRSAPAGFLAGRVLDAGKHGSKGSGSPPTRTEYSETPSGRSAS